MTIAFLLVTLGFYRPEHTELPLIGFVFIFLLSLLLINNSIEYKTGQIIETNFTYTPIGGIYYVNTSSESTIDVYTTINSPSSLSHTLGYWLAICSVVGFIGVLVSLRRENWGKADKIEE
jgi:hypothetical protein